MKEFTNDWETYGGMRNLSITSVLYDVMVWCSLKLIVHYTLHIKWPVYAYW